MYRRDRYLLIAHVPIDKAKDRYRTACQYLITDRDRYFRKIMKIMEINEPLTTKFWDSLIETVQYHNHCLCFVLKGRQESYTNTVCFVDPAKNCSGSWNFSFVIKGHGVVTDDAEPELFVIRDKLTGREILYKPPSKLKFSSFPPQVRPSRQQCCGAGTVTFWLAEPEP